MKLLSATGLPLLLLPLVACATPGAGARAAAPPDEIQRLDVSGFALDHEALVRGGTPEEVFDLFTGDVTAWWDHHFSERPVRIVIEPEIGGRFYEVFDEAGNGAQHARVTYVKRGAELHFTGPLGFASLGVHFDMVHRFLFVPTEEGTLVRLSVHGVGEIQEGWPEAVQGVWHHFLDERFVPYAEERLDR